MSWIRQPPSEPSQPSEPSEPSVDTVESLIKPIDILVAPDCTPDLFVSIDPSQVPQHPISERLDEINRAIQALHPAKAQEPPRTAKSLRELLDDYIEGRAVGATTRAKFGSIISSLERRIDLDQPATAFDVMAARKLQTELAKERSAATVNDYFGKLLNPALALAVEIGGLTKNPCANIKSLRSSGKQRLEPSWEDAHGIIADLRKHARNPKTPDLIQTMLYFGIGQGEIKGLKGEHVDLKRRELHLVRQKTRKAYTIPIFDHALEFALKWKLETGTPVIPWHDPERPFHFACERLGMPKYELRALRRTFIVRMLEAGIEPRLVAQWQGHADATMIIRIYGKNIGGEHRKAQMAKVVTVPSPVRADVRVNDT